MATDHNKDGDNITSMTVHFQIDSIKIRCQNKHCCTHPYKAITWRENAQAERQQDPTAVVAVAIVVILKLLADLTVNLVPGQKRQNDLLTEKGKTYLDVCDFKMTCHQPEVTPDDAVSHNGVEFFQSRQRSIQSGTIIWIGHDITVLLKSLQGWRLGHFGHIVGLSEKDIKLPSVK